MNYWIFKTSPKNYRLSARLADPQNRTRWTVSNPPQFRGQMRPGDVAFILQTGSHRSLRAKLRIDSEPKIMRELEIEQQYRLTPATDQDWRVDASITARGLDISVKSLATVPGLEALSVLRQDIFQQSTVFPVTSSEGIILARLSASMRQFVVYHSPKKMKHSFLSNPEKSVFTGRTVEGMLGNRVWLVTGEGHPCRYYLAATFIVDEVGRDGPPKLAHRASGKAGSIFDPLILIDEQPWFEEFADFNGDFAFGLREITTKENFVRGLRELAETAANRTEEEIEKQIGSSNKSATTKDALIKARIGQGPFRDALMKIEKGCRMTRVSNPDHLIASHSKPWKDSTDEERLDGNNGLLLSPNIDHLFDRGIITFTDQGELKISRWADREALIRLGVETDSPVNVGLFTAAQAKYLDYHRREVFEKR